MCGGGGGGPPPSPSCRLGGGGGGGGLRFFFFFGGGGGEGGGGLAWSCAGRSGAHYPTPPPPTPIHLKDTPRLFIFQSDGGLVHLDLTRRFLARREKGV